jgi:lipid-A-disaccharide synthase-like uncharacterized protein
MTDWRAIAYPLGFLSSLAFMSRFLIQWTTSELHKRSMVTRTFWILSLIGNSILMLHAFIQVQFHVCLIQACSIVLSMRNLNLLRSKDKQWPFRNVIIGLSTTAIAVVTAFVIQSVVAFNGNLMWISIPHAPWHAAVDSSIALHLFGSLGVVLFASRFWIQWWHAEKQQVSSLNPTFWWLSLIGACLSIIYFSLLGDAVNAIGPAIGVVPYFRNLMLLRRERRELS